MVSTARDLKLEEEADGIDEYQVFPFRPDLLIRPRRRCATKTLPHLPARNEGGAPIFSVEHLMAY